MAVENERSAQSQAGFIFAGQVLAQGAATMDAVPLNAGTLVVGVLKTIVSPEMVGALDGFEITVQLASDLTVEVGNLYLFHAEGWLFGDGLAVICTSLEPYTAEAEAAMLSSLTEEAEAILPQRVANAELIITGRVTQVKEVRRLRGQPITEHSPEWHEATIAVESVEGGAAGDDDGPKTVKVRFAYSLDSMWANAPKMNVGDHAIYILGDQENSAEMRGMSGARTGQYTVIAQEDVWDMQDLEQLRHIVKGGN